MNAKLTKIGMKTYEGAYILKAEMTEEETKERYYFEGFLKKKDGTRNKKTCDTLALLAGMGELTSTVVKKAALRDVDFFLTDKVFDIEVVKNDAGYDQIEWINDPENPRGGGNFEDVDTDKLLGDLNLFDEGGENDEIPF